jgi:proline dehydrogenase
VAGLHERNNKLFGSIKDRERLLASQNGVFSMELVNSLNFQFFLSVIMVMGGIVQ